MPVTSYNSIGGLLLGESDSLGNRVDYLTDGLGSVVGTVTSTASTAPVLANRYRYKPYGSLLSKTGTASDPAFTWVGTYGYRQTTKAYSDVYVRARHYSTVLARWTTRDRNERVDDVVPYLYAVANPLLYIDPEGHSPIIPQGSNPPKKPKPWESSACQAALKAANEALPACFSKGDIENLRLAEIMLCIAYGESDCKKSDNSGGNLGLYQISCDPHYKRCIPKESSCCGCKSATQIGCNTQAAVNLIAALIHWRPEDSLGGRICFYWGVLPCPGRPLPAGPEAQGKKTTDCLKAKGIDIFKTAVPNILATCPGCPGLYS